MRSRRIVLLGSILLMLLAVSGCGKSVNNEKITIAYQYGLSYAPVCIVQDKNLIEKNYKELTGKDVEVEWTQMSSGSDINAGFVSGSIQVGMMGISPAIIGIQNNMNYRIFGAISGQPHGMMTNISDIKCLGDYIGTEHQIAIVNLGSFQHILLAKALYENGYDPHSLDRNLVAMKNPDGKEAVVTGAVSGHVTSNQYILSERNVDSLHELTELSDTWSYEKTHTVGIASKSLYENNPDLYKAICLAFEEADDYIISNTEEAAVICSGYDGSDPVEECEFLKAGTYTMELNGLVEIAEFMYEADFIEKCPASFADLVFDNVNGN